MQIPMLSDLDKSIAKNYGVCLDAGIALRGMFIIDDAGVVRSQTVNDLPVGRNVDEALRTVKAFQYVAEHGEVCPANWNKGDDTMIPDVKGSQKYFGKQ